MKHKISLIITFCLLAAILGMLLEGMLNTRQESVPAPQTLALEKGEYSLDDGQSWIPLENRAAMRRWRGDLILRGQLQTALPAGETLHVRLMHMGLEARVNGEEIFSFAVQEGTARPESCAKQWVSIPLPQLEQADVLELRISPLHARGTQGRHYEALADSLYLAQPFQLHQWLDHNSMVERLLGQLMLMVGVTLLGIALAAGIMKSPLYRILLYTALLAIGEGANWVVGARVIVDGMGGSVAFYSVATSMSRVLVVYALMAGVSQLLLRRSAKLSHAVACCQGVISAGFVLFGLVSGRPFCSYELIWSAASAPFVVAILALCVPEVQEKKYTLRHRFFILAHMVAFGAILFSFADRLHGWGAAVDVEKVVCGLMALIYAAALFFQTPASHQAVQNAKKLSEELSQSRIVLAMSQISTHFIFNVLNAISSLCKTDPDQADVELVRFARYLRTNINIMQEDKPISFEMEMDHVQNYVELEQLRFDERIMIDERYEVTDFMLPSLIVQPLVENAIKHGLLPKENGGTIRLSTRRQGQDVVIEIADDGVGFKAKSASTHKSVGLSNVRFRVEKMAGGRMEIESELGQGTTVRVILPYQKEAVE